MPATGDATALTPRFRLLIDTNVLIAVEPFSGATEANLAPGARLLRTVAQQGQELYVHQATVDDIEQDRDEVRRRQRLAELQKYVMLKDVPMPAAFQSFVTASRPGTNDYNDLRLLAALKSRAITHLVSEDIGLRKRASRLGLGDAVLTIDEAILLLQQFTLAPFVAPPRVEEIEAYALDVEQEIFDSLRLDYAEFDVWLDKVRADWRNRICFVIEQDGKYAALALLKPESACNYEFRQPVLKLATMKVAPGYAGSKYGELLLKTVFSAAAERHIASVYVEVHGHHELLIQTLIDFGFTETHYRTVRGELVYLKQLREIATSAHLGDLEYHVRYGPPAIRSADHSYFVPIEPKWHDQLFPDAPSPQLALPGIGPTRQTLPWGNALRKAYLCHANTSELAPGYVLLFYRTKDRKGVTALGVVEQTLRSIDANEILTFVGRRTVYSPDQITHMCRSVRPVLAVLFRQDRFIDPPWSNEVLNEQGLLTGWPQTIGRVRKEGLRWLHDRLAE